jgi:outer membrane putative beta-barrel porin/alpha-amylase
MTAALALRAAALPAQELEPRAYSPNPTGAHYVLAVLGRTAGGVVFDPAVPIQDVSARVNTATLLYGRTFGLFGRSASLGLGLPYAWGTIEGEVQEQRRAIRRSGLADGRLRLAVNLLGGPALAPRAFATRRPRTTLGARLVVAAPTGQYDPAKLVNIGANRWSVKPELGVAHPAGRWMIEAYLGTWLFTDNREFYGERRREQSPLGTAQAHVSYTFKPRLWVAGDATFYTGGRTTVGGRVNADRQKNSRLGLTLAVPVTSHQSVKASWGTGFTTRIGGDFDTLSVGWQYLWF